MSNYLLLLIVLVLMISVFLIGKWLLSIWRFAGTIALLTPAIIESEPFYKLIDMLLGRSHAMERHGPITTMAQQIKRANKGITPEGIPGKPVHSGRWSSHYSMLQAIEESQNLWQAENSRKRVCYVFKFDRDIGIVVKKK